MNDPKYNRALHVRAIGTLAAFLGDVKKAKSGVDCRAVQLVIRQRASDLNENGDDFHVVCLLYGRTALSNIGQVLDCSGCVVDYGTRLVGKEVKPKLVFAANTHCAVSEKKDAPDGLYAALAGRVAYVGKTAMKGGMVELPVGVAVSDFPGMIGVLMRGEAVGAAQKHDLLFVEGEVFQFGLSDDGKRPAMKVVGRTAKLAFTINLPK